MDTVEGSLGPLRATLKVYQVLWGLYTVVSLYPFLALLQMAKACIAYGTLMANRQWANHLVFQYTTHRLLVTFAGPTWGVELWPIDLVAIRVSTA